MGLPRPGTKEGDDFRFEERATFKDADGVHRGRADLVRQGAFIIECKQFTKKERASKAWNLGMQDALGQALDYANGLERLPVFVIACDVGHCFESLACFDGSGVFRPFPASGNRIYLRDLRDPKRFAELKTALVEPSAANPARLQVEITTDVAEKIGELARQLRAAGHDREVVARFLLRCLFTMFAEDVGLFEKGRRVFEELLREHWLKDPSRFVHGVSSLWQTMNTGGYSDRGELIHKFNGGLFRDHGALPLTKEQLQLLHEAAKRDWSKVEPAIFGTLLENALGEKERHQLGAHFTPKAYVERLVRPTVEEPLRAEWLVVRAQVRELLDVADGTDKASKSAKAEKDALATLKAFHQRLCKIRVLDPACGTGNFLYVAMELMKLLEAEVLEEIRRVGGVGQEVLELGEFTVSPKHFLGIEKNPWAKEIAEVVLWIGYLRWHWQLRGGTKALQGGDSILRDEKNIECRDAVLDWDGAPAELVKLDAHGKPVTRWDGETTKVDPVTGRDIPDDSPRGQKPIYEYPNARKAKWPDADFIVGNPPFIGNKRMRLALGHGYVEAIRSVYDSTLESADFVMYWWLRAAETVSSGGVKAAGLITTNSISQTHARKVVSAAITPGRAHLSFAIPDHPWVDADSGAAVRIAMTVVRPGSGEGRLMSVTRERPAEDGIVDVTAHVTQGRIGPSLNLATSSERGVVPLQANRSIAYMGVTLIGDGFRLDPDDPTTARLRDTPGTSAVIRSYVMGKDLAQQGLCRHVIDLFGIAEASVRTQFPEVYQHVYDTVRLNRMQNPREAYRLRWWVFGEPREGMRAAVSDLQRYIVTARTARHRCFQFVRGDVLPDSNVIAIASDDAGVLAALSARPHRVWARHAGATLEDRPHYTATTTFAPYAFPASLASLAPLGEALDAHRKRQLAAHPKLTITSMYNVLEKLRAGEALTDKDKAVHEEGLVSILRQLHDELDAAVFDAYGWPHDLSDEQILEKLVALNAERAAEEARGLIRYLRPDFQAPKTVVVPTQPGLLPDDEEETTPTSSPPPALPEPDRVWPKDYFAQASAVRDLVASLPDGTKFNASSLDAHFKGKAAKREELISRILSTFAKLGHFVTLAPGYYGRPVRRAG